MISAAINRFTVNIRFQQLIHGCPTDDKQPLRRTPDAWHTRKDCLIQHISAWACLVRSDFNFVFVLFSYFIFVSNREDFVVTVVSLATNSGVLHDAGAGGTRPSVLRVRAKDMDVR